MRAQQSDGRRSGAAVLDEDSLLWRFLGDRRFVMSMCRAITLQMLHPAIASATHEFSLVPRRVFVHKQRTAPCVIHAGYDDAFDHVRLIQYSHDRFRGFRPDGRPYHALNPSIFFFEHATYVDAVFTCAEVFFGGLDDDQQRQLYAETCEWYRRYGLTPRVIPASLADFREYFAEALETELDPHPGLDWYRDQLLRPDNWYFKQLPTKAVRAIQHPVAARHLGIEVSASDRHALTRFAARLHARDLVTPRHHIYPDDLTDKVLAARRRPDHGPSLSP